MTARPVEEGGIRRYGAVLTRPHMASLIAAAFVGRLPVGMYPLAIVLFLSKETGSFAVAGAATGAFAISSGISLPFLGRTVDRIGQTPVLVACAVAFPVSVAGLIAVAQATPEAVPVLACAVVSGISFPPLFATLRALISVLAGGLAETAFALEAMLQEVFFIVGPLLVALIVALASAQAALVVAAVLAAAGTLAFASTAPSRRWERRGGGRAKARALASSGIRTIVMTSIVDGMTFGTLEVALPAFAQRHGSASAAGVMLGTLAFGSMLGGFLYGARNWSRDPSELLVLFAWPLAAGLASLSLANSVPAMIGLLFVTGVFIAPSAAASFSLVGRLAPGGAVTEAFTWLSTAVTAGFAAGGLLAGLLVQHVSVEAALLTTAGCAVLAAGVLYTRRGTLRPDSRLRSQAVERSVRS
jgi:MFS family permease